MQVNQGGGGDFKTINEAIKSIPTGNTKRVIIKLAPGEYKEKVTIDKKKPFITLMGDPKAMPVLTFDGTAAQYGTVNSASLIILSDYFIAENIIVKVYIYLQLNANGTSVQVVVKMCNLYIYILLHTYIELCAGTRW